MFGILVDGSDNIYCDNEAVTKNTPIPESTLKKKHHSVAYHRCRELVAAGTIRVAKQGTRKNLAVSLVLQHGWYLLLLLPDTCGK